MIGRTVVFAILALATLALAAALVLESPTRAVEAARVLADIAAGEGPSGLKAATPAPERLAVGYTVDGRERAGDVYLPGEAPLAGLVVVPGADVAGKDHPLLVALVNTLARARFAVLVPDMAGLRELKVRPKDAREIADAFSYLAEREGRRVGGRLGIAAISYAVGPAILAALEPDVGEKVRFVVGIGGYYSLGSVVTFLTTGHVRDDAGAGWLARQPSPFGKWAFVLSNAEGVSDDRDRLVLERMARRRLKDRSAPVDDLIALLGPEGRSVHALLANTDPERVGALMSALPEGIRAAIEALDLAGKDLHALEARLILIHGQEDGLIPASESKALAGALPSGQAKLFLVPGVGHIDTDFGVMGGVQLWRAVYRLLEERDGAPGPVPARGP